jgi:hypothetical protein
MSLESYGDHVLAFFEFNQDFQDCIVLFKFSFLFLTMLISFL